MTIKPTCVFTAPLWTRSGYGDWSLAVAKSLIKYDKFNLKLVPTPWGQCTKIRLIDELERGAEDDLELQAVRCIMREQLPQQPEVFIQMTIPNEFHAPAKFNIGMTAGIETTLPKADWLEGLNRMNATFCLSNHVKNVLGVASYNKVPEGAPQGTPSTVLKCERPLEVCFWGIDTTKFYKTDVIEPAVAEELSTIPEETAFLFVGQWTHGSLFDDRKDIGNLIKTFCETFRGIDKKPCLILKTNGAMLCNIDREDMLAKLHSIRAEAGDDIPNVYLLHGNLSTKEMNSLYNHPKVKAFVTFTHGEGQGDPILQATLAGKPVLAPRWSGQLDYLNSKYAVLLDGELKPVSPGSVNDWIIKESSWFYVDYKKAGEKMWDVMFNYNPYLEKAEKLRLENVADYSVEAMDKVFHSLLDKYVPKFAVNQPIILPKLKKITLPKLSKPMVSTPTE